MINQKHKRNKILYKKFIALRINANNNSKVLKFKKKKWDIFLDVLKKQIKINKKSNFFTHYEYAATKFASPGNSLKRKFKNDLIARKIFSYFYGGLLKKNLKKNMRTVYSTKQPRNLKLICLELFESRLDSTLYRSKFCFSIKNSRQLISHGHVIVNNKVEKNKSYILKKGDFIKINRQSYKVIQNNFRETLKETLTNKYKKERKGRRPELSKVWPIPPKYLTINYKTLEIIFGNIKDFNFSIYFPFKLNLHSIIENCYRH